MARRLLKLGRAVLPAVAIFLVVAITASSMGQDVPQQAPVGQAPPGVSGVGAWLETPAGAAWADGEHLRLDKLRGDVVVLEFWTTWCPGCKRAEPTLKALSKRFGKQGLKVIGITIPDKRQTAKDIQDYVKAKIDHPVAVLQTAAAVRAYGVSKIPYAVVIGRDGTVTWKGNPNAQKSAFKAAVKAAIKAKAPPTEK